MAQSFKFLINIDRLGYYDNKGKNSEIQMFQIQGSAYFRTDLKWLAHKIWMLKSNFKLVGRKFVRCFIALQNFKKLGRV